MSRIGKAPVTIPSGVEVKVSEDNVITVKGAKAELTQQIHPNITVKIENGEVTFDRIDESKVSKAQHGLNRSLIFNMIEGLTTGYKIEQELIGVGYRATVNGRLLELMLGFSHPIVFEMPEEVKATAETVKGKPPKITLESYDKQLIGQVAAKIRSFRKPEPYKGKGVRYVGEQIRRKAGKAAAK